MKSNQKEELILLHFSDFHFGRQNPYSGQLIVLQEIWDEIKSKLIKNNIEIDSIDLVVITGDLSSIGSASDFEFASQYFTEILFKDINKDIFIIIPGNHDLEFAMNEGDLKEERFENYLKFKKKLGFNEEHDNSIEYLKNPHFLKTFKELSTCILCLNSCMYTAYDIDPDDPLNFTQSKFNPENNNYVKINENQLKSCLKAIDSLSDFNFKLMLLHHNILPYNKGRAYLSNFYKVIKAIEQKPYEFNIILHGHLHKKIIDKYSECFTIGAGSFGVGNNHKDVLNEINILKLRKEHYPFSITWIDVLTIKIDYDEQLKWSVVVPQDWISETLEMLSSRYLAIVSQFEMVKNSILKSQYELAFENIRNLQSLLYESTIKDKENVIRQIGRIFYDEIKKTSKEDTKRVKVFARLKDKIDEFKDVRLKKKKISWLPLRRLKKKIFSWLPLRRLKRKPIAWSPIRRLMGMSGLEIVARDAVDKLLDHLEDVVEDRTKNLKKLSHREHRKKITKEDMESAIKKTSFK
ncbi:hypothetical protein LCGC14_1544070 [marine sediment metagenome]|uniref:Calcineurin-like phosphoesterase domain-containing protein n=1 Tax=marine sediment metagenome TaxID=412755 RepID=A0A0F9IS86_9ZZZZ